MFKADIDVFRVESSVNFVLRVANTKVKINLKPLLPRGLVLPALANSPTVLGLGLFGERRIDREQQATRSLGE